MAETFDVVVIGAGILGASTAYHLIAGGASRVLLMERGEPASGGTGKSAAIVRQHYSNEVLLRLARDSVAMFRAMPEELCADGGYNGDGWCMLVPPELMEAATGIVGIQNDIGIDSRMMSLDDAAEWIPEINPDDIAGVAFEVHGGYADPVQTTEAYVETFKHKGGVLRLRSPARGLIREGKRITGVLTDDGAIGAGTVVNACGPWSKALAASADLELRMRAVREQDTIWEARPGRPIPRTSVSNAVDAIYLRPSGENRFVIGRGFPKEYEDVDPNNYKETAENDFEIDVQTRTENRFPGLAGMKLIGSYAALYDVTPDWYPVVGPRESVDGYMDASGGSGHGFKISPAMGRALARTILDGNTHEDIASLGHDRFDKGELFVQKYGGNRG